MGDTKHTSDKAFFDVSWPCLSWLFAHNPLQSVHPLQGWRNSEQLMVTTDGPQPHLAVGTAGAWKPALLIPKPDPLPAVLMAHKGCVLLCTKTPSKVSNYTWKQRNSLLNIVIHSPPSVKNRCYFPFISFCLQAWSSKNIISHTWWLSSLTSSAGLGTFYGPHDGGPPHVVPRAKQDFIQNTGHTHCPAPGCEATSLTLNSPWGPSWRLRERDGKGMWKASPPWCGWLSLLGSFAAWLQCMGETKRKLQLFHTLLVKKVQSQAFLEYLFSLQTLLLRSPVTLGTRKVKSFL